MGRRGKESRKGNGSGNERGRKRRPRRVKGRIRGNKSWEKRKEEVKTRKWKWRKGKYASSRERRINQTGVRVD